jgi:superoxide dismutase, Fe-Mn family
MMARFKHIAAKLLFPESDKIPLHLLWSIPREKKTRLSIANRCNDRHGIRLPLHNIAIGEKNLEFCPGPELKPHAPTRKNFLDSFLRDDILERGIDRRIASDTRFEKIRNFVALEHVDKSRDVILVGMCRDHPVERVIVKWHHFPEPRQNAFVRSPVDENLNSARTFYIYGVSLPDIQEPNGKRIAVRAPRKGDQSEKKGREKKTEEKNRSEMESEEFHDLLSIPPYTGTTAWKKAKVYTLFHMTYQEQKFNVPELKGISQKQLEVHLGLYGGYVKHVNVLREQIAELQKLDGEKYAYAITETRRRLGFEFDGMRMHEYYFEGFEGGAKDIDPSGALARAMAEKYGDWSGFVNHLRAVAGTRGIGWVVAYFDVKANTPHVAWVGDHELGQLSGIPILLAMDMWEHAYMVDYTPGEKKQYVEAYLANTNWEVMENRFTNARG